MKKTKAAIAATFLVTLATSIVLFFVVFINFLQHISSGKEFDFVMLTALLTSVAVCLLSNLRYDYLKRKKSANTLIDKIEVDVETVTGLLDSVLCQISKCSDSDVTSNEVPKTDSAEKAKKRSHHSRKNSFDVQKAIESGMAMYVDGKRHVYVSLKPSPAGTDTEVRGISNGVFYGYLDHIGKGIHNNHNQINGYLINV